MESFAKRKPDNTLMDLRIIYRLELDKTDLPQDQRTQLLLKLADLEILQSKKWKHHTKSRRERAKRNKGGRPKRMFDSAGNPLYNNSPKPKSQDSEESLREFMEGLSGPPESGQD